MVEFIQVSSHSSTYSAEEHGPKSKVPQVGRLFLPYIKLKLVAKHIA